MRDHRVGTVCIRIRERGNKVHSIEASALIERRTDRVCMCVHVFNYVDNSKGGISIHMCNDCLNKYNLCVCVCMCVYSPTDSFSVVTFCLRLGNTVTTSTAELSDIAYQSL